ncbi:hypothetical protein DPMN_154648, partial [Dreissena polymorpha]
ESVTYTNWVPNHMSNFVSYHQEDCIALIPYQLGQWDDIPCGFRDPIFGGDTGETHYTFCEYSVGIKPLYYNARMASLQSAVQVLLLLVTNVHADFSCICNYNIECAVYASTSAGSPFGQLYEFDCKPEGPPSNDPTWVIIQYEHKYGYVKVIKDVETQICSGAPPEEDIGVHYNNGSNNNDIDDNDENNKGVSYTNHNNHHHYNHDNNTNYFNTTTVNKNNNNNGSIHNNNSDTLNNNNNAFTKNFSINNYDCECNPKDYSKTNNESWNHTYQYNNSDNNS